MVQTVSNPITLGQFLQQPETKPAYEYIDGQILQKPRQEGKHSILQGDLVPKINHILRTQKIAWAFPELRLSLIHI